MYFRYEHGRFDGVRVESRDQPAPGTSDSRGNGEFVPEQESDATTVGHGSQAGRDRNANLQRRGQQCGQQLRRQRTKQRVDNLGYYRYFKCTMYFKRIV